MSLGKEFLSSVIRRLKYYKGLGEKTFEQLTDEQIHYRPNEESNSIAMIVQHMNGNMLSRWTNFLTEDGEKEWRQRDDEFEVHQYSRQEILALWDTGWQVVLNTLESLTEDDLLKTITIRREPLIVVDAINRQFAHYPYHVGQIIYIGKEIKNTDWKNLSVARGHSEQYTANMHAKFPDKRH